jgi:NAD-dependent dihydropyrimidine dehydrogenase PreA subunit
MKAKKETWKGIERDKIKWFPTIDYDKCTGCMACLEKCSHNVYSEENGKPKVKNPNNCVVGCTGCDEVCPQKAISHPSKEYLKKLTKHKDFKIECSCGDCCS